MTTAGGRRMVTNHDPAAEKAARRGDRTNGVAEDLVAVLDMLSRVCAAADGISAYYLWDKTGQLAEAARRLHHRLSQRPVPTDGTPARFDDTAQFDGTRVQQLVTEWGRHYRAGRLLYPEGGDPVAAATAPAAAAARRHALQSAAVDLLTEFGDPAGDQLGLTRKQADDVARWLRDRAR